MGADVDKGRSHEKCVTNGNGPRPCPRPEDEDFMAARCFCPQHIYSAGVSGHAMKDWLISPPTKQSPYTTHDRPLPPPDLGAAPKRLNGGNQLKCGMLV
eukprot:4793038-Pleurochrysis_carterae.AAC.13